MLRDGDRATIRLAAGAALSAVIHALALALILGADFGTTADDATAQPLTDPPDPTRRVTLGDPTQRRYALSWIALDRPREHASVDPSVVIQPELSPEAAPVATPGPTQATRPSPPREPRPAASPATPSPEFVRQAAQQVEQASEAIAEARRRARAGVVELAERTRGLLGRLLATPGDPSDGTTAAPAETAAKQTSRPTDQPASPDRPPSDAQAVSVARPATQPPGGGVPAEPATPDEREADAVSTIEADLDQIGSDLSAAGLRIVTAKPRLFHITAITQRPRNPVCVIHFGRNGVPTLVALDPGTGSASIDQALLDVIYAKWRAKGPQLEGLDAGNPQATLEVRVRILF